ncbi:hypothetical protein [Streptomyces sp. SID10115]|uniref:hypothetical protein n=1 Tax=Streptomyces sp. SID10115 TaxID=2706016 RepID=UPI0013ECAB7B|nr:hypothetical protein [Streptomyces sp. SID10115]
MDERQAYPASGTEARGARLPRRAARTLDEGGGFRPAPAARCPLPAARCPLPAAEEKITVTGNSITLG